MNKNTTTGLLLGYARVSTDDQDLTNQRAELQAAGCTKLFSEKGTVAKLAMRQPFVLFKGLTFQKLC
ncbi:recombinase family protein, partial [Providencia huaxiensis]|uniref:recombinase family protein n=1 Tax=Providencia huaxiensis TaxID=2027290 RepID=UPI0032DA294E